jgi:NAD(P)-dependent dehydrogenase (short-subunit alcohol dehydrogenase family)
MSPDLAARFSLDGRNAIITGASGTLGARFAEVLAGAGAGVALAARRTGAMAALRDRLEARGSRVVVVAMDVTDAASVAEGLAEAEAALGLIDIVVNNSGVAEPAAALDQTDADWSHVFAVNVDGARRLSTAAVKRLAVEKRPGAIVNVASILGLRQGAGVTAYAASKAALIQMTKQHALEWARHGVRVNALAPGYVETDINRDFFASEPGQAQIRRVTQRRLGKPEELDGALLLLASEAGSFITGTALVVDGGHLVSPL